MRVIECMHTMKRLLTCDFRRSIYAKWIRFPFIDILRHSSRWKKAVADEIYLRVSLEITRRAIFFIFEMRFSRLEDLLRNEKLLENSRCVTLLMRKFIPEELQFVALRTFDSSFIQISINKSVWLLISAHCSYARHSRKI